MQETKKTLTIIIDYFRRKYEINCRFFKKTIQKDQNMSNV